MFVRPNSRRLFINSIRIIRPTQTLSTPLNRRTFAQTTVNMSTGNTITDSVLRDHREVEECYEHIVNANDDDTRTRWQNQFTWELARHSHAEEIVVYPAFEKHLGAKGKEMASKDRQEHQVVCDHSYNGTEDGPNTAQLKDRLYKFQSMKPSHPEFMSTLNSIMEALREHIKEEERDDMPALERALSSDDSIGMAKSFNLTKAIVPSRSHPWAPNKPPMETAAGLPVGVMDHIMDVLRKFPDKTISPNPSTK